MDDYTTDRRAERDADGIRITEHTIYDRGYDAGYRVGWKVGASRWERAALIDRIDAFLLGVAVTLLVVILVLEWALR